MELVQANITTIKPELFEYLNIIALTVLRESVCDYPILPSIDSEWWWVLETSSIETFRELLKNEYLLLEGYVLYRFEYENKLHGIDKFDMR